MAKSMTTLAKQQVMEKTRDVALCEEEVLELVAATQLAVRLLQDYECDIDHEHHRECRTFEISKERAAADLIDMSERLFTTWRDVVVQAEEIWKVVGREMDQ